MTKFNAFQFSHIVQTTRIITFATTGLQSRMNFSSFFAI